MEEIFRYEDINVLKPLEKVFPNHLENLSEMINEDGMDMPLIVDIKSKTILDGSHRYAYILREGYNMAPVIYVDYDDERITTGIEITKKQIVNRTELLPARTTRHKFPFIKHKYEDLLKGVEKREPRDISHLLEDVSVDFEIEHNKKFLAELKETQSYIEKQLGMMKPKAVFVGKFNPPHIGHALTILKLKEKYNLELCITNDNTVEYLTQEQIAKEMEGFGLPVHMIEGRLIDYTHNPFDNDVIILSGNEEVKEWANKYFVNFNFVERSGLISSSQIRNDRNS